MTNIYTRNISLTLKPKNNEKTITNWGCISYNCLFFN